MKRLSYTIFLLLVVTLVGGAVFLSSWDMPAPSSPVSKVLPDDRFPR